MPDVQTLMPVVDLVNQPALVAFDVEHGPFVHSVHERLLHILRRSSPDDGIPICMRLERLIQVPTLGIGCHKSSVLLDWHFEVPIDGSTLAEFDFQFA